MEPRVWRKQLWLCLYSTIQCSVEVGLDCFCRGLWSLVCCGGKGGKKSNGMCPHEFLSISSCMIMPFRVNYARNHFWKPKVSSLRAAEQPVLVVRAVPEVTVATAGFFKAQWKRRTGCSGSYCHACLEAKGLVDAVTWVSGSEKTASSWKNTHVFAVFHSCLSWFWFLSSLF